MRSTFLAHGFVAALVCAPIAAEQAIESAEFEDRLGTLPVEISLSHNGVSTLDTGILGSVYWERTGFAGFGRQIRTTGPPEAGGSLASYVSPRFIEANAQFVSDPGDVARVYGDELRGAAAASLLADRAGRPAHRRPGAVRDVPRAAIPWRRSPPAAAAWPSAASWSPRAW